MLSLKARFVRVSATLLVTSVFTLGAAIPAFADPITTDTIGGSGDVQGGDLTIAGTTSADFSLVTLNGTNKEATASATVNINDDTGTGAGWDITLSATPFTNGSHVLADNALSITSVDAARNGLGTYTDPQNAISSYSSMLPGVDSVTMYSANDNTGMGHFTLTPNFKVQIPANTYAGTYTSTFTVSIVTGPA